MSVWQRYQLRDKNRRIEFITDFLHEFRLTADVGHELFRDGVVDAIARGVIAKGRFDEREVRRDVQLDK